VGPDAQASATATTRAGILAILAAAIAALGAAVALAETRRANLAADERERDAQAADRYTSAIAQLGESGQDKLDVRLGGIYALQRLAQDFPRDYRSPIVEVLCAFVRHHGTGPDSAEALEKYRPATDVQAALTVVGRIHGLGEGSETIDLVEAHLERAQLPDANLNDAILIKSYLTKAHLYRANLRRAELFGADLTGANLSHAVLVGAYLRSAMLQGADLEHANLTRGNLSDAKLTEARLARANMADAILIDADLSDADLVDANLTNADLRGAKLTKATLALPIFREQTFAVGT
jgi:uncharacterized protein YjbI with pentapeptide repeats